MIDPAEFRLNAIPPPVQIEELRYRAPASKGADASTTPGEIEVRLSAPFTEPLRLPPGSREIEISYSALSLSAPEKIRFQTRLDGTGYGWDEPHDWRATRFYERPPGDYVFHVRAANNDGVWNEIGTSLAFSVQPYYWQTGWFRVSLVCFLIIMSGVAVWGQARRRHRLVLAELERTRKHQAELAHLSRITMLGELSVSLAHELNQPLTAILSNAQAAQRFLAHDQPDIDEVRAILVDIVAEDKRAGEVIRRLRLMLKKDEAQHQSLLVNDIVQEVLRLVRNDMVNQSVEVQTEFSSDLPVINGDRVQLQQVLLNLILNACDAMNGNAPTDRQLVVRTEPFGGKGIRVSISDCGTGIASDHLEQVFEPFFTTKSKGLGLGLSVCSTIITAHGGKLWAANNPVRGATFHFTLPG
jgi:signal transduction histidine kinase